MSPIFERMETYPRYYKRGYLNGSMICLVNQVETKYEVQIDCEVVINGAEMTLADLKQGMALSLSEDPLNPLTNVVAKIDATAY
jgi:hypothetical protein